MSEMNLVEAEGLDFEPKAKRPKAKKKKKKKKKKKHYTIQYTTTTTTTAEGAAKKNTEANFGIRKKRIIFFSHTV